MTLAIEARIVAREALRWRRRVVGHLELWAAVMVAVAVVWGGVGYGVW